MTDWPSEWLTDDLNPNFKRQRKEGRNHVRPELAQIAVELAREADGARDARETRRDEMVQVSVCGSGELQGPEAYVATQCNHLPMSLNTHARSKTLSRPFANKTWLDWRPHYRLYRSRSQQLARRGKRAPRSLNWNKCCTCENSKFRNFLASRKVLQTTGQNFINSSFWIDKSSCNNI